jgi:hypothetical protein
MSDMIEESKEEEDSSDNDDDGDSDYQTCRNPDDESLDFSDNDELEEGGDDFELI